MCIEQLTFKNPNDLKLSGVLHAPGRDTDSVVIIAHGFCSNKTRKRYIKLANALTNAGIAALRFDFGGSGESDEREVTIESEVHDLKSAIAQMRREGYENIGLLGESLGGIVSLKAYGNDIDAMVLWAPVTKSQEPAQLHDEEQEGKLEQKGYIIKHKDGTDFKIPQQYFDERMNVDREALFKNIDISALSIHGNEDEHIPMGHSEEALEYLPKG
jgi:alpha-beta hydrolase superfamily lysophospholipase